MATVELQLNVDLKKKSDNRVSFPKENTLYYFYCKQQMHNQYQNSIYKYIYITTAGVAQSV